MGYPESFDGFMVTDASQWSTFHRQEFKPKRFNDNDVDIKIECCGVCGSDVHSLTGGWGAPVLPLCVGHEVVGRAVRVGSKVSTVRVGDRVGVGAQIWSCLKCDQCAEDNENYCPDLVHTYGWPYPESEDPEKTRSQGGYASHIRAHEFFCFPIPDEIPSHVAAPMMCAGLTVYSPLVRAGIGPGKRVAVVGMGGLGHFAVLFAAALGAEVTVLSHSTRKKEDALKLGATHFVLTHNEGWAKPLRFKFDLVLNTADATHTFNLADYLSICKVNKVFHQVGLPDHPLKDFRVDTFCSNGALIGASHIGNRPEALAMLKLVAEKNLDPVIQTIPISEAGCKEAVERVRKGDVRYRITLVDYDKVFE